MLRMMSQKYLGKMNQSIVKIANNCRNPKFPLHTIQAIHTPKNRTVKVTPAGTIEDTAFLDKLEVKEQARVMLIHNVNTSDGLTNGAQGTIVKILTDDSKVRYILVKFDNKKVGRLQRQKFKFLSSKCDLTEVTPVERISFSYTLGDTSKNHAARATVLQFPLRLCWALTAHKVRKREGLTNKNYCLLLNLGGLGGLSSTTTKTNLFFYCFILFR